MWCSLVLPANPDRITPCEATRRGWSFAFGLAALTALCLHSREDQHGPPDFALWPCLLRLSPPELLIYSHPGLSARLVFEPFPPGLFTSWLPRSVLPRKASLTKQPCQHSPSPTRAGERNTRWRPPFPNPALTRAIAFFWPRSICQTSSLLLPAATACAPATFGLSASLVWPSFSLATDRLEYTPCDIYPPHIADAVSSASSGSLRLWLLADQLHSVRSTPA